MATAFSPIQLCEESLPEEERQKFYRLCRIFSYRVQTHQKLSRKLLVSSLPGDSSLIVLWLFIVSEAAGGKCVGIAVIAIHLHASCSTSERIVTVLLSVITVIWF